MYVLSTECASFFIPNWVLHAGIIYPSPAYNQCTRGITALFFSCDWLCKNAVLWEQLFRTWELICHWSPSSWVWCWRRDFRRRCWWECWCWGCYRCWWREPCNDAWGRMKRRMRMQNSQIHLELNSTLTLHDAGLQSWCHSGVQVWNCFPWEINLACINLQMVVTCFCTWWSLSTCRTEQLCAKRVSFLLEILVTGESGKKHQQLHCWSMTMSNLFLLFVNLEICDSEKNVHVRSRLCLQTISTRMKVCVLVKNILVGFQTKEPGQGYSWRCHGNKRQSGFERQNWRLHEQM